MAGDRNRDEPQSSDERLAERELDQAKMEAHYAQASLVSSLVAEQLRIIRPGVSRQAPPELNPKEALLMHIEQAVVAGKDDPLAGYEVAVDIDPELAENIISAMHICGYSGEQIRERFGGVQAELIENMFEELERLSSASVFGFREDPAYGNALKQYIAIQDKQKLHEQLNYDEFVATLEHGVDLGWRDGAPLAFVASQYADLYNRWRKEALTRGEAQDYITLANIHAQTEKVSFAKHWPPEMLAGLTNEISLGQRLIAAGDYRPDDFGLTAEQLALLAEHKFTAEEMYDVAKSEVLKKNLFNKKPSESDEELGDWADEVYFEGVNTLEYIGYLAAESGCFAAGSCEVLLEQMCLIRGDDDSPSVAYSQAIDVWHKWRGIGSQRRSLSELQKILDAWAITTPLQDRGW